MPETYTARLIMLNLITIMIISEEHKVRKSSLYHSLKSRSLLGPNIVLTMLLSKALNLRSSQRVRNQVLSPHKCYTHVCVRACSL